MHQWFYSLHDQHLTEKPKNVTWKISFLYHGVIILNWSTTPCFYIWKSIEIGKSLISSALWSHWLHGTYKLSQEYLLWWITLNIFVLNFTRKESRNLSLKVTNSKNKKQETATLDNVFNENRVRKTVWFWLKINVCEDDCLFFFSNCLKSFIKFEKTIEFRECKSARNFEIRV